CPRNLNTCCVQSLLRTPTLVDAQKRRDVDALWPLPAPYQWQLGNAEITKQALAVTTSFHRAWMDPLQRNSWIRFTLSKGVSSSSSWTREGGKEIKIERGYYQMYIF
ncbi:hypothetical protein GUJ93_ZPchr0380g6559, partial [Zizania palustris]